MSRSILVTGGLGFIGSAVALWAVGKFSEVICVDNLYRPGVSTNSPRLDAAGVRVVSGDIRLRETWDMVSSADVVVHCASEPAVANFQSSIAWYSAEVNTLGTLRMLEWAKDRVSHIVLLSTSRVYSQELITSFELEETRTRFEPSPMPIEGVSTHGLTTQFPTRFPGSLYGASKLAAEEMVGNWAYEVGGSATINRCGVVTGPGQFGTASQGFMKHFVESCRNGSVVAFRGYGGLGKQVRDILYVEDFLSLLELQLFANATSGVSEIWNVSGGIDNSVSLLELVSLLETKSGKRMNVIRSAETASFDVAWLVLDSQRTQNRFGWQPEFGVESIVDEIWRAN